MILQVAGIDYQKVPLALREYGAFTEEEARRALMMLQEQEGVFGAALLATCNRTELYVHTEEEVQAKELFARMLDDAGVLEPAKGALLLALTVRRGDDVCRYLMEVACGMHSQIFGEDQIVTQVKRAWVEAHEYGTADPVLERLFQSAVTAAKRVKTECRLTGSGTGAAQRMVEKLQQRGTWSGKTALVIGNGQMGRAAAEALVQAGMKVTMTVRHYKTREVVIPAGCQVIDYTERYAFLQQADVVVSATRSPHLTLEWDMLRPLLHKDHPVYFVDLAVPRDLPNELQEECFATYENMDTLGKTGPDGDQMEMLKAAQEILEEEAQEFRAWLLTRKFAPVVRGIADHAASDLVGRLEKSIRRLSDQPQELRDAVWTASAKTVASLLFHAQKELDSEQWKAMLEAMAKQEETV